jgi:hypothetical protein
MMKGGHGQVNYVNINNWGARDEIHLLCPVCVSAITSCVGVHEQMARFKVLQ